MGIQRPNISGNAGSATRLQTARNIGGVSFNGTGNINLPGVNEIGNQDTYGNAGSATRLSSDRNNWTAVGMMAGVVGQIGWRNFGNGHTVFDASAQVTPTGSACSNTTPENDWAPGYPTLMGSNGSTTFGVRVQVANKADTVTTITTAQVTTATAQAQAGEVGTYAMLSWQDTTSLVPGTNVTVSSMGMGQNLMYANAAGSVISSQLPSGQVWKCMSHILTTNAQTRVGVFIRVS